MNAKEILRTFTGSVVVYAIVASCSPSGGSGPSAQLEGEGGAPGGSTTTGGAETAGGSGDMFSMRDASVAAGGHRQRGSGGASILDAAIDRMTHPVPDARADSYESGSRIKARYLVGDDGSREFEGWHDSLRNEDCGFVAAQDGTKRCLPIVGAIAAGTYFSDSGCAAPLAVTAKTTCTTTPEHVQISHANGCGQYTYDIFNIGAKTLPTSIYQGMPGSCTALADASVAAVLKTTDFYSVSDEIDPKAFVAGTTMTE